MPQASSELRALMKERFGSSVSDAGPRKFLLDAGYTIVDGLIQPKPGVKNLRDTTREEFEAAMFLCHEWDYEIDYISPSGDFREVKG